VTTRGQQAQGEGPAAGDLPVLLREGDVLASRELLKVMLGSEMWDEKCKKQLAPYLDTDGRLRVSTTISKIM
jgi:hypothetical protein